MKMPQLSVGVCAYNEAKNLEAMVSQLLSQKLRKAVLKEVIIVSSGSTDGTDGIAKKLASGDRRVIFLREQRRNGKVSAVNMVLDRAKGDIVFISGADLRLEDDTLDRMVAKFSDAKIGMVGARPVPVNDKNTLFGFCSHLVWGLHHYISLSSPKCGELIAIRNNGYVIPKDTTVDEAYLEWVLKKDGYSLAYADDAIVHNRGPDNFGDYITQRRRIHAHHLRLKRSTGYDVSTTDFPTVLGAFLSTLEPDPKALLFSGIAVALEGLSSLLGAYDIYIRNEGHQCWEVAKSTKEVG
jgi:glycosyltransferase involved in cell wall biosynthesis